MRLRLIKEPFDHPDYVFELKHDGFRAVAYIDDGECRLDSRNLRSLPFKSKGMTYWSCRLMAEAQGSARTR
jgi:hypothetical protein